MMKPPWQLRDYIFAGAMSVGMLVSAVLIPLIAPRFLELVFWTPNEWVTGQRNVET